ncbi:MAG: DUF4082 domain-containing protein [Prosthecobacter sp.]
MMIRPFRNIGLALAAASAFACVFGSGTTDADAAQIIGMSNDQVFSRREFMATSGPDIVWGYDFTVGAQGITVQALGMYDDNFNGLGHSHQAGLWDQAGTLLATVTLDASSYLGGYYRYTDLVSPVTLTAGQNYTLGLTYWWSDNDDFRTANVGSGPQPTFAPEITMGGQWSARSDTLVKPTTTETEPVYFLGANAIFSPVPEPSSLFLIGVSALVVMGGRRRARKQKLEV